MGNKFRDVLFPTREQAMATRKRLLGLFGLPDRHVRYLCAAEFQGMQTIHERYAEQHTPCSFSEGPGDWYCFRFGNGGRTYRITVEEVD